MSETTPLPQDGPVKFNEPQKSRILAAVSYIDKLLLDVEEILTASASQAFPKYRNPLTPVQMRVSRDYINRLRQQIVRVLKDLEIPLPLAKFDSTHSIRVTLQFIEVAIEEIAPERLTGYGTVPPSFASRLAGGLQEMKGIVRQMDSYLVQRPDADLSLRVARLSASGGISELLSTVATVIDRHGFVEFRAPLNQIVQRIESPAYEIAFFGRVSAGKSSLLNRIIGTDLLPTGVTPVTAVPTRIRNRAEAGLLVWTADGRVNRYGVERLADFVTELRNPGNDKRVTRLIAEIPLAILPEEVVLVDTPGLGSLALEGAAETLAYLPQCDLGVVLVDASSNLHSDDVATLDALRAASIPSAVVLSKADLVNPADLAQLVEYTTRQVGEQLGVPVDVTPLSSHPEKLDVLQKWVQAQIAPRIANARRLATESNERKASSLAERVLHALEMSIKTAAVTAEGSPDTELKNAENRLRQAAGLIERTNEQCFRLTGQIREAAEEATKVLADNALSTLQADSIHVQLDSDWFTRAVNAIAQKASEELASLIRASAQELSEALNVAAQATETGKRGEQFSLESLVKELPAPDFPRCSIELHRPRSLAMSLALARHSIRSQIASECGTALAVFFNSYGRALELWFRTVLTGLEREFNGAAEVYRAQLQRLTAPIGTARPNKSAALEDIAVLKQKLGITEMVGEAETHMTV